MPTGRATIRLLNMNAPQRVEFREAWSYWSTVTFEEVAVGAPLTWRPNDDGDVTPVFYAGRFGSSFILVVAYSCSCCQGVDHVALVLVPLILLKPSTLMGVLDPFAFRLRDAQGSGLLHQAALAPDASPPKSCQFPMLYLLVGPDSVLGNFPIKECCSK
jgi:hypothetical protein